MREEMGDEKCERTASHHRDCRTGAGKPRFQAAGGRATPVIDRFWFKSVYFKEPGGVLFELATDGPGFAADEDPARLGEKLVLPPWLDQHRTTIERTVPPLTRPAPADLIRRT